MMKFKQVILPLFLLAGFACLVIFISTSFELTNTAEGAVKSWAIGFGTPWYQQITSPTTFSRRLNLLAPSFLSGIAGLLIIWISLRYY